MLPLDWAGNLGVWPVGGWACCGIWVSRASLDMGIGGRGANMGCSLLSSLAYCPAACTASAAASGCFSHHLRHWLYCSYHLPQCHCLHPPLLVMPLLQPLPLPLSPPPLSLPVTTACWLCHSCRLPHGSSLQEASLPWSKPVNGVSLTLLH